MHRTVDPIARRRLVAAVVAWALFGFCWWLVLRRDPRTWRDELLVPAAALVVVTAITLAWVRHNLGIYRRKGPRRGLPHADPDWRYDSLGRPLHFGPEALCARIVQIEVRDGVKRYSTVR